MHFALIGVIAMTLTAMTTWFLAVQIENDVNFRSLTVASSDEGGLTPAPLAPGRARAFCYLPLPVSTGLPVHLNAVFALHSNRRALSVASEDDKRSVGVDWNRAQLSDSATAAYALMLTVSHRYVLCNLLNVLM